jgi:hypothetical protein
MADAHFTATDAMGTLRDGAFVVSMPRTIMWINRRWLGYMEALLLNLHPVMHMFSTSATVFDTLRRQQTIYDRCKHSSDPSSWNQPTYFKM